MAPKPYDEELEPYTAAKTRAVVVSFMNYRWTIPVPDPEPEDMDAWAREEALTRIVRIVADNKEEIK